MNDGLQLFGAQHLTILFATILLPIVLIFATKAARSPAFTTGVLSTIAIVLIANRLWALKIAWDSGLRDLAQFLPLHLCDVATFMVVIACFTRHPGLIRTTYFFAMAGTLQAILTPDIRVAFPEPRFITFFVAHCGIVVAALYLTFGLKIHPNWSSLIKSFLWLQLYAVTAITVNTLFGTNYGYLAHKPENPSVLDFFGPWPWYILVLELVALIKFTIVLTPFLFFKKNPAAAPPHEQR